MPGVAFLVASQMKSNRAGLSGGQVTHGQEGALTGQLTGTGFQRDLEVRLTDPREQDASWNPELSSSN